MRKTRKLRLAKRLSLLLILTCTLIALHVHAQSTPDLCDQCEGDYERCREDARGAVFSCGSSATASSSSCIAYAGSVYNTCTTGCGVFLNESMFGDLVPYYNCMADCAGDWLENLDSCSDTLDTTNNACDDLDTSYNAWCEQKHSECRAYFCEDEGGFQPFSGPRGN